MIRVVYHWQVKPENIEEFQQVWRVTTNHIHASVTGALGSFMLKAIESESTIVTVANWRSLQAWQDFWGNNNPSEMAAMRALGERISVEVYEELEDHTR